MKEESIGLPFAATILTVAVGLLFLTLLSMRLQNERTAGATICGLMQAGVISQDVRSIRWHVEGAAFYLDGVKWEGKSTGSFLDAGAPKTSQVNCGAVAR